MNTYRLTLHRASPGEWMLFAPGTSAEQIASGAKYLNAGEGRLTQGSYNRAAQAAAKLAADLLDTTWDGSECIYHDDGTGEDYLCDDLADMVDLYGMMCDEDESIARDAYSHWCSGTTHDTVEAQS